MRATLPISFKDASYEIILPQLMVTNSSSNRQHYQNVTAKTVSSVTTVTANVAYNHPDYYYSPPILCIGT